MSHVLILMGLRATWVVAIAGGAALLLRRRSASLRAAVWASAMIALIALPALPRIAVSVPATPAVTSVVQAGRHLAVSPGEPVPVAVNPAGETVVASSAHTEFPWSILFFGGMGLVVVAKAVAWFRVRRLIRAATPPSQALAALGRAISDEVGLRQSPAIYVLAGEGVPFTVGAWRPKILLPASAMTWEEARADMVLRHEVAHIARGDWPILLIAQAAHILFWYHPLVWLAIGRLRLECEQAADDMVLAHQTRASDYATELRAWAQRPVPGLTLPVARRSGIGRRLRRILDARVDRRRISARGQTVLLATVLLVACALPVFGRGWRPVGPSSLTFEDGSELRVVKLTTWSEKQGYAAWDIEGNRLPDPNDAVVAKLRKDILQLERGKLFRHPVPAGQRWVATYLSVRGKVIPSFGLTYNAQLNREPEGIIELERVDPLTHEQTVRQLEAFPEKWRVADGRVQASAGPWQVLREIPVDGKRCKIMTDLPARYRTEFQDGEDLVWVGYPAIEFTPGWNTVSQFKWSNGEFGGECAFSGLTNGFVMSAAYKKPGAHIVSVIVRRQRAYETTLHDIALYPKRANP